MANPFRGETELTIDGASHKMRLTLGALVELEQELDSDSLLDLIMRFESGAFKTADLITLLTAGLRGAGWQGDEEQLLKSHIEGGPVAAAKAAGDLLKLTFTLPE